MSLKVQGREIGATGTKIYQGQVWNTEDYNPDWHSQGGMAILDEMYTSDADIDGCLSRIVMPLVAATWNVEPYAEDKEKGPTDQEEEDAEFCRQTLLERDIVGSLNETSFEEFVDQTLRLMLVFGHMTWEHVWGVDDEGRQVIAKLAARHPKAAYRWLLDKRNNLEALEQYVYTYDGYEHTIIPAEKLSVFTFRREGDNWWGRSILRSSWRQFVAIRELMTIDTMRHELAGRGFPVLYGPEGGGDAAEKLGKKMMREARAHERAYMFFPDAVNSATGQKKWIYELVFPGNQGTDIKGSIEMHEQKMLRSLMNEFQTLGANVSGSRNLGDSKMGMMLMSLQALVKMFSNTVRATIFKPQIEANRGPKAKPPFLVCEDLDAQSIVELAQTMQQLTGAQVLTPDDKLEDYVRTRAKWPKRDPDTARGGLDPNDPLSVGGVGGQASKKPGRPDTQGDGAGGSAAQDTGYQRAGAKFGPPKTAYDPNQPRDPKGVPTGGQWTDIDGAAGKSGEEEGTKGIKKRGDIEYADGPVRDPKNMGNREKLDTIEAIRHTIQENRKSYNRPFRKLDQMSPLEWTNVARDWDNGLKNPDWGKIDHFIRWWNSEGHELQAHSERTLTEGLRREMLPHEAHCNFAEMRSFLDSTPEMMYADIVRPIRQQQIERVAGAIVDMTDKQISTKDARRPLVGKLTDEVFAGLKKAYLRGRATILEERKRQRGGQEPTRPDTASEAGTITAGVSDLVTPSSDQLKKIRRLAELFAENATDALISRALRVAMTARLAGIADGLIEEMVLRALFDLSEKVVISDVAGKVAGAFTAGRNDQAQELATEVQTAFYSAIMDKGTEQCTRGGGTCESLDGSEHKLGDPDYATPNPHCAWPENCRCVTVVVFKRD